MLDADAELERFLFERHTATVENGVGVASTVPNRQQHHLARNVARRRHESRELAVAPVKVLDATIESHFAAERFNPPADRLDDGRQSIAAQVRPMFIQDRRLAFAFGKEFQDAIDIRTTGSRGQLAVAERAGAAFAEQIITPRIEWTRRNRMPGRREYAPRPACHVLARPVRSRPQRGNKRRPTRLGRSRRPLVDAAEVAHPAPAMKMAHPRAIRFSRRRHAAELFRQSHFHRPEPGLRRCKRNGCLAYRACPGSCEEFANRNCREKCRAICRDDRARLREVRRGRVGDLRRESAYAQLYDQPNFCTSAAVNATPMTAETGISVPRYGINPRRTCIRQTAGSRAFSRASLR